MMKIYFLFLCLAIQGILMAQVRKQLYLSNDDHTDYMWTGNEEQYTAAFTSMLDYYIRQSDESRHLPTSYQSRFNCDGSYWLWEYEKNKTGAEFIALIDKIKSGHISVPYNALVSCYGAAPLEGILRGMYYAGYLERKYALELDQAVAMENQTLPLGLASLWAGAGVKYSWKGVCNCATAIADLKERDNEIYWYKGLDSSKVLMKWYSIPHDNTQIGGYAEARDPAQAVDALTRLCQTRRYPYHIAGAFGYGWDDLQTTTDIFSKTAAETTTADREVIVSNQSDFFKAFESAYGKNIPAESLAYGNEWDVYSASMAEVSASVKRSVEKLRAAEAMASVVSLTDPGFAHELHSLKKTAWMSLGLYYEHDWTADGPVKREDRAAWQRKIQGQITSYVDSLHALSQRKLSSQIRKKGNGKRFYAFNPLGWERDDICDFPYSGPRTVKVVDVTTRREVASQFITRDGNQYIRILAKGIPSLGYKVYELIQGKRASLPDAATFVDHVLENDLYRVKVNNQGVITSLVDKRHGNHECVARVNGRFMNDLGSGSDKGGTMAIENNGPVSVTVICKGKAPLEHTSRITLYNGVARVDIDNEINENFSDVKSWAFSYNLSGASVWHEETGAVLHAKPATQGGHYASRNARFDWLTLNHFADISNGEYGITLSNADASFMKLGNSALMNLDLRTAQLSVLAGGQVDGENLGIPKQDGDSLFVQRFALGTHGAFDASAAMRFSLEHQNPMVAGVVSGTDPVLPEKQYSFLTIPDPAILLWCLKPAEDGDNRGLVARVWNMGQKDAHLTASFQSDIGLAYQTTHVETDIRPAILLKGDLSETIGPHQQKTFRIVLKSGSK